MLDADSSSAEVLSSLSTIPPITASSSTVERGSLGDELHRIAHNSTAADQLYASISSQFEAPALQIDAESVALSTQVRFSPYESLTLHVR